MGTRRTRRARGGRRTLTAVAVLALSVTVLPAGALALEDEPDPRIGLGGGITDAEEAIANLEKLSSQAKPEGFSNPNNLGSLSFANSDLAFADDHAFVGNFHGFNIYDVSDPAAPVLRTSVVCPGGQGDVSVHGDLLFMSVEETRGRIDCASSPTPNAQTRFRGVRIFDISDLDDPVQLPGVQTCAGSHTHSLLVDPDDGENVYIYNSGTAGIRSSAELAGCNGNSSLQDPTTTNFSIDVIQVPLAAPETASVVSRPRIFSTCGSSACESDYASGALNGLPGSGLQPRYPADSPRAPGGQSRSQASRCHDITLYPQIGLGAGACQGWGLLLDISDPVNPVRIDAVEDYNFAYWHSATFNNDGTKVIFTDEWGGGTGARCRATDNENWGANAIFDIVPTDDGPTMEWASYYKLPVPQTSQENCVAHNGSLIPVPGRDLMVQAWYQGGLSIFDFSDSADPYEIAYFDRGPNSETALITGGFWSTYWFNGSIYGSEMTRGFDTFALLESDQLSASEIAAARSVTFDTVNPQGQAAYAFTPSFDVVGSYRDQLVRADAIAADTLATVDEHIANATRFAAGPQRRAAVAQLTNAERALRSTDGAEDLRDALLGLADSLR